MTSDRPAGRPNAHVGDGYKHSGHQAIATATVPNGPPPGKAPKPPAPGSRVYRLTPEERDQLFAIAFCLEDDYCHLSGPSREWQMRKDSASLRKIIGDDRDGMKGDGA